MESLRIFDEKFFSLIKNDVTTVQLNSESLQDNELANRTENNDLSNPNNLSCSYCRAQFSNTIEQREHYKLDWHRYNLKQSLLQKSPVTENEFNEKTFDDDISSISGSDSEKEDTNFTSKGKLFLKNPEGKVFAIYSCLLSSKKEEISTINLLDRLKDCTLNNQKWTILMLGGGHFAGAVFNGDNPILHKTFHCYTVRAGQGGQQSSRDNRSANQPKSAGASLRRYNEQALVQHVRDIVDLWRTNIMESSLIIYRASGPYNRSVLFGGGQPLLDKNDKRLRAIPFTTRRATFAEVKRVHSILTLVQVYDNLQVATERNTTEVKPKRIKTRPNSVKNRSKSRELIERPNPIPQTLTASTSSDDNTDNDNLITEDLEISFDETLQIFDDSLTEEQRQNLTTAAKKRRKRKPKKTETKKLKEKDEVRKKKIMEMLLEANIDRLIELLIDINEILDENSNTLLHLASLHSQKVVVEFLLDNGADVCSKNDKQQTPYTITQNKEIRDLFKEFAKNNPEKFNYNKAQIPVSRLTQEELSERKKAQRKIKKDKEKLKKKENEVIRQEVEEKERFLKLSDREKRALAAERRILSQSGAVLSRCFLCASDITGKVPFEYLGNRFCSMDCLKAHRLQNPTVLS